MNVKLGDTVVMTADMPSDPCPVLKGDYGVVTKVSELNGHPNQYWVEWVSGRTLILLETDPFIIKQPTEKMTNE